MDEKKLIISSNSESEFYERIASLINTACVQAKRQVDSIMVSTYYEVGRLIVEREQQGKKRAQYGKKLLMELSNYLAANVDKRYSVDNLKLMRRFYRVYSDGSIGESVIPQFTPNISWTHYIQLMRIKIQMNAVFMKLKRLITAGLSENCSDNTTALYMSGWLLQGIRIK